MWPALRAFPLLFLSAFIFFPFPGGSQSPFPTSNCSPPHPVAIDHWRGEYFNNRALAGSPSLIRDDGVGEIDFDWGLGGPSKKCNLGVDEFSARWTRTVPFGAGAYRFTITADDGVRLFIDGEENFASWNDQALTTHNVEVALPAGNHRITLEYYERLGSAVARLTWERHPCIANVAPDHWRGEYFSNPNLTGRPILIRDEGNGDSLNFDGGEQGPDAACPVPARNFSARWTRKAPFGQGFYRFQLSGNSGVRVYIDGKLRFENWSGSSAIPAFFDLRLEGGNHLLVVESRAGAERGRLSLNWEPLPCFETVAGDHWRGEYFNTGNLSGRPVMVRDAGTGAIDFDWGLSAPDAACSIRADEFSVRWSRAAIFAAGTYRFTITADDGVRLRMDGRIVLDAWRDQPVATHTIDLELAAGKHLLVLEYYDRFGSATAKLSWAIAPCTAMVPGDRWRGEYFNNAVLEGASAMTRDDGSGPIDFDWGLRGPESGCGLNPDNFSARWTRVSYFGEGIYRFNLTADDGVRVYIDRQLRFERWRDQASSHSFNVAISAGNHRIVVEYFEHVGAAALKLGWERHPCFAEVPADRWRGEYFNNPALSGAAAMIRDDGDAGLNFDWGAGGPAAVCGINADDFSVRWSRRVLLDAGWRRFTVTADDGVRLFVNGKRVIDRWRNQAPSAYTADLLLPAGRHHLVLEFYDHTAGATARLEWEPIAAPAQRAAGPELMKPRP
ncbi:MAG: PA14 domain-containing protein [Blastocatellia bacterium]